MKESMSKTMYSSSSTTSSHRLYKQPWFFSLCLLFFFHLTTLSCSSTSTTHHHNHDEEVSYADHCSSIVPESTPISNSGFNIFSFPRSLTGYFYTIKNGILSQYSVQNSPDSLNYLSFHTRSVQRTSVDGVFKVKAMVRLKSRDMYYSYNGYANYSSAYEDERSSTVQVIPRESRSGFLRLGLNGFWSESSGKLCMVGLGTTYSKQTGEMINIAAALKLTYFKNSSIVTSLETGSLESLSSVDDSSYFEKVPIFTLADKKKYAYSSVLEEHANGGFNGSDAVTTSLPIGAQPSRSLCSILSSPSYNEFELKYRSDCKSAKNCTPFADNIGYLPSVMALNSIQCSDYNQRVRVLVKFLNNNYGGYYQSFNPNTTLIGEGLWDEKKNQLCVVACQILNVSGSLNDAHIGDCSIRLTLRFPAVWSIKDSRNILGQIWSSKPVNDSEYFNQIVFQSSENRDADVQGLKYEYTMADRARKLCPSKKAYKNKMERYPNMYSYDMSFDMSVSNSKEGRIGWGYSTPLFVGDQYYKQFQYAVTAPLSSSGDVDSTEVKINSSFLVPVNISYKMSFYNISNPSHPHMPMEISAEGIYDPKTGDLCMIGCNTKNSEDRVPKKETIDCEILVKYQFPSLNSKNNGGYIKGSIESTREKTDPLYFKPLGLSSIAYISSTSEEISSRMDFEVTMVLISTTLACVFVAFQLSHVRKRPQMLPFASLVMLTVLTLGYMFPLLLNFEALFLPNRDRQNVVLESGKWLEMNEVLVRVVTMVAFLLHAFSHVRKRPQMLPFASLVMLAVLTLGYMIPLLLNFEALFLQNRDRQNVVLESGKWLEVNEVLVRVVTMVAFLLQFRLLQMTWSSRVGDGGSAIIDIWASEKKSFLYVSLPLYATGAFIAWLVNQQNNNNNNNNNGLLLQHSIWGDLKSYAGLVLDTFLLPQIILNMFGNTREKSLSFSYYMGTTFVRLLPHAYDLYRAHSNNAREVESLYIYANHGVDFYSTSWDVIIPCVALVFAVVVFLQQQFGGRCILPRRFREVEEVYEKVPVVMNEL